MGQGCGIYEERPTTCREFYCAWLQGTLPVEMKPDKVKFVMVTPVDSARVVIIHEDPSSTIEPTKKNKKLIRMLDRLIDMGMVVFVLRGNQRRVMGRPESVERYLRDKGASQEVIDAVKRAPQSNPVSDIFIDTVLNSVYDSSRHDR